MGPEELRLTKENLGWPQEPAFLIPEEALGVFRGAVERGEQLEAQWRERLAQHESRHPESAREWRRWTDGRLPEGWQSAIPAFPADPKGAATRVTSGTVLNAIAARVPNLIGGSADLAPSNKTLLKDESDFQAGAYQARNLRFGVREHGMAAILNGMALHGGLIPYGGTFLVFSDYMRPAIRLAALMGLKVIYVFTHDSIGLGEDGPTHQPVEHLMALRSIPNLTVLRPGDANETAAAWRWALESRGGPVALALTRQGVPTLDRTRYAPADGLARGAYILKDAPAGRPDLILIGTGSELQVALEAGRLLEARGIAVRLVSMPSWELFERQPAEYRHEVLPPAVRCRVAVEAGRTLGWERYTGSEGEIVGLDRFGASAPYKTLYEQFGLTAEGVVERALRLLGRKEG